MELTYFEGYCGHEWIGSIIGSYACPVCGAHDGDHNIKDARDLPVQIDVFGCDIYVDLAVANLDNR